MLALIVAAVPSGAGAQSFGSGVRVQSYTFDDPRVVGIEHYSLVSTPFAASVAAGRWFRVNVSGSWARGRATASDGLSAEVSGVTDTQLGIDIPVGGDRAVITLGATIPSGQTGLSLEEAAAAAVVTAELLPFAVTTWGAGGGYGGDLALAFAGEGWGVGLSGGYRAAVEYDPLFLEEFSFRPGDQLRFRVALDKSIGSASTLSLLLGVQHFGDDQLEGNNLFQAGSRVETVLSYAAPLGVRGSLLVYGGVLHRGAGNLRLGLEDLAGVDLAGADLDGTEVAGAAGPSSQNLFLGGTQVRLPAGRRAVLLPDLEMRVFRTGDGVGQGWVASAGGSVDLRIWGESYGRRLLVSPSARYRTGMVMIREGEESGLRGWEAGLTLRMVTGS